MLAENTTGWIIASTPSAVSRSKDRLVISGDVTLSDSYSTGGDGLVFPDEYGTLRALYCSPQVAGGYMLAWNGDPDDPGVQAFSVDTTTGLFVEADAETDLSTISVTVIATFES